jgi:CRISPR-associated endonuclease Csn1
LFGFNPLFDIEHIYPKPQSFDNSFANKTLCRKDYNLIKGKRIPFLAFSDDTAKWREMIGRVKKFKGPFAKEKLKRFKSKEIPADFTNRMLNDNSYVATAAVKYLSCLYGGIIDRDGSLRDKTERAPDEKHRGKLRVQVIPGQATARLRKLWRLNPILGESCQDDEKNRTNHCHHAIDALVIAYCTPGMVKQLAEESEKADDARLHGEKYRFFIKPPQDKFVETVKKAVDNINVSYRVNHKVSGALHKDTNYSPLQIVRDDKGKIIRDKNGKPIMCQYIRESVEKIYKDKDKKIEKIIDPTIRNLLENKTEGELPYLVTNSGNKIPIRKVKTIPSKNVTTITIAKNSVRERHVTLGNNHHIEVFEVLDKNGKVKKLDWRCVSLFEAMQRVRAKRKVIARSDHYGDGTPTRLKFSLAKGEYVQATPPGESTVLLRVCKISNKDITLCLHSRALQQYRFRTINNLKEFKVHKVTVDYLGNIHPAND